MNMLSDSRNMKNATASTTTASVSIDRSRRCFTPFMHSKKVSARDMLCCFFTSISRYFLLLLINGSAVFKLAWHAASAWHQVVLHRSGHAHEKIIQEVDQDGQPNHDKLPCDEADE